MGPGPRASTGAWVAGVDPPRRRLDAAGVDISDLALRRPTLDDVFLALTGHAAEATEEDEPDTPARGSARRRPARSKA